MRYCPECEEVLLKRKSAETGKTVFVCSDCGIVFGNKKNDDSCTGWDERQSEINQE